MNRSFNKIRHIQESNRRLEQRLVNELVKPALLTRIGTTLGNIFKKSSENESPEIEAAYQRLNNKASDLKEKLKQFKIDFDKLYVEKKGSIQKEMDKLNTSGKEGGQSDNYKNVDNRKKELDSNYNNIIEKIELLEDAINKSFFDQDRS